MDGLGDWGDEVPGKIVRGCVWGPFDCEAKNPDGSLVDFTDFAEPIAQVLDKAGNVVLEGFASFTGARTDGTYKFGLDADQTVTLVGRSYDWKLIMVDPAGRPIPWYYGQVLVKS